MKQDVGFFDVGTACPDLIIEDGDLKADNGLETASLISVFTNRRVTAEELPRGEKDRMGWWADQVAEILDDEIGSKVWLIDLQGKTLPDIAVNMESYLQQAFDWMIDDGIASEIVISSEILDNETVQSTVLISRPNGENIPFRFVWDGQKLKLLE